MNMVKDWTAIQRKYKGLWVALADNEETVVASGKSAEETLRKAKEEGYADAILTRMPTEIEAYVGFA